MYCFKCGNELMEHQAFCPNCGAKQASGDLASIGNNKAININHSDEFNRDILENYLSNLRSLEFAKSKLLDEKNNIQNKMNALARTVCIPQPKIKTHNIVIALCVIVLFLLVTFIVSIGMSLRMSFFETIEWLRYSVIGATFIACCTMMLPSIIILPIVFFIEKSRLLKNYDRKVSENNLRMKRETAEKARLQKDLFNINKDIKNTDELLKEQYSLNIVPDKYRNIGAIYFLHQNYSTSMMTFSEVLYHCDLEEINQRLNEVIYQQRELIMEIAYNNSLNEQLVQQNNKLIDSAIRQEENLKRIEQYQRMQTYYAKTNAQIQSYYFYRRNGL